MLDALKFVQGATTDKGLVPALSHFRIKGGRITGFNGALALSAPISVGLDLCPHAGRMIAAIEACDETVALSLSKGKLLVNTNTFKTHVDCLPDTDLPVVHPEGRVYKVTDNILPALEYLSPFIAEDASRPWACGIMFDGQSAYATNNIVLQQYWLGYRFPCSVIIPRSAVAELLRIGISPDRLRVSENSISFEYADGRWLRSQLLTHPWPAAADIIEAAGNADTHIHYVKGGALWAALERIIPFTDAQGTVYLRGDYISTQGDDSEAGTCVACPGVPTVGKYNAKQLIKLREVADRILFDSYPNPVYFTGGMSRGIIVGLR